MHINTISIPKDQAKELYEQYWNQLKEKRTLEDEAIAKAYKACAKGHVIINIQDVMREAGINDKGLPNLAIARANAEWVYYHNQINQDNYWFTTKTERGWNGNVPSLRGSAFYKTRINGSLDWPRAHWNDSWHKAMVPIVPPQFRPRWKLSNYHILFEAIWEKMPPVDPILLKHVHGDIYIVLAQWDLTEIERAIIAHRFN